MTVFFRNGLELVQLLRDRDDWDDDWFLEVLSGLTDTEIRGCLISARDAPSYPGFDDTEALSLLEWEFDNRVATLLEGLSSGQLTVSESCP